MADGHIVFQGDVRGSPDYFRNMGYKFNRFSNPADVFMRILSVNYPKTEEDESKILKMKESYETNIAPAL